MKARDDETAVRCSQIKVTDFLPDIGRVTAVTGPDADGEIRVTAAGRTVPLHAGGVVRKRGGDQ